MTAKIRVAINGFGRIGRGVLRASLERETPIEVVAVNDPTEPEMLAHLLMFDTVHGRLRVPVRANGNVLEVGDKSVQVLGERDPSDLPWGSLGIDVVIESTGRFTAKADAERHLSAGAARVIISAPSNDADVTICVGVNDKMFDPSAHLVISNASCTTNCLAPMVKVLNDRFRIASGFVTTVHAYTNDQNLLDLGHRDPRRARAAAQNITPSSTGAARAIGEVVPALAGRLDGLALRVPVPDGSITDLVCSLELPADRDEINEAFADAATDGLRGILEYSEYPMVSGDVIGNPHSCVFSAVDTLVGPDQVKILGWYDNEWGYANRLLDLVELVHAPEPVAT